MILYVLLNVICLGVGHWALKKSTASTDIGRYVVLLMFAAGSLSFLTILILLFDFLEATANDFWSEFLEDKGLIIRVSLLFLSDIAYGWFGIEALRRKKDNLIFSNHF
jgi:hypothetical protein